jgi:hypothetical protein
MIMYQYPHVQVYVESAKGLPPKACSAAFAQFQFMKAPHVSVAALGLVNFGLDAYSVFLAFT